MNEVVMHGVVGRGMAGRGADARGAAMSNEPSGGTSTLDRELEELLRNEQVEDGDHDLFAHYVRKEKIVESAVTGKPVKALCGKVWVPGRDPQKFPVCPDCKKIYDSLAR